MDRKFSKIFPEILLSFSKPMTRTLATLFYNSFQLYDNCCSQTFSKDINTQQKKDIKAFHCSASINNSSSLPLITNENMSLSHTNSQWNRVLITLYSQSKYCTLIKLTNEIWAIRYIWSMRKINQYKILHDGVQ
jgi:hypothetical protein